MADRYLCAVAVAGLASLWERNCASTPGVVANLRLRRPHRQFITVRINEVKPAATGERKGLAADHGADGFEPLLRAFKIIRIQDHQRATRSNGLPGSEPAGQPAIAELGVGGAVIDECPAENGAVKGFAAGDVADIELDVVEHMDLVKTYGITRTPTTLIIDKSGTVHFRATGVPKKAELTAAVTDLVNV